MKYVILVIIALVVIYLVFRNQINSFLGIGEKGKLSCKKVFYAKLTDGKYYNIVSADIGTTTAPDIKYYKKQVTFDKNGVIEVGIQTEITKDEFSGLCQYIYHPPFDWYAEASKQVKSSESQNAKAKTMARGGVVDKESPGIIAAKNKAKLKVNELVLASRKQIGGGMGQPTNFPVYSVGGCYHSSIGGGPNKGKTAYCCLILKDGVVFLRK